MQNVQEYTISSLFVTILFNLYVLLKNLIEERDHEMCNLKKLK